MHEHSLVRDIVKELQGQLERRGVASAAKVKRVILEVGALELHSAEAFRQAFAGESKGTLLESAALDLTVIPVGVKCDCGFDGPYAGDDLDVHSRLPVVECPGCKTVVPVHGGRGVPRLEVVVEE
jgi:Zn finger protein HypA/HybF involved in hydrogenase expression